MSRAVRNVHERAMPAAATREQVRQVLASLSGPDDLVWPGDRWPPMVLDRGLAVGSAGGHGTIRYTVQAVDPDQITFRFNPSVGLLGTHRIEVAVAPVGGLVVRHTIEGQLRGVMRLLWHPVVEPLHDALIEDALDGVSAALAHRTLRRRSLPVGVELRRRVLRRVTAVTDAPPGGGGWAAAASGLAAAGLLGIGALHAAWGAGLTYWPATDQVTLARTVVGGEVFPSAPAVFAVAALLALSALAIGACRLSRRAPWRLLSHAACRVVVGVLALRGVGGLMVSGLGLGQATEVFRANDLLVYSPLCLALALGAHLASRVRPNTLGAPG